MNDPCETCPQEVGSQACAQCRMNEDNWNPPLPAIHLYHSDVYTDCSGVSPKVLARRYDATIEKFLSSCANYPYLTTFRKGPTWLAYWARPEDVDRILKEGISKEEHWMWTVAATPMSVPGRVPIYYRAEYGYTICVMQREGTDRMLRVSTPYGGQPNLLTTTNELARTWAPPMVAPLLGLTPTALYARHKEACETGDLGTILKAVQVREEGK